MQASALAERMRAVVPTITIVAVALVQLIMEALAVEPADLLLATDLSFPDGDVLDLIFGLAASRRSVRRFMVVTAEKALHPLIALRKLSVDGVFDPDSEGLDEFGRSFEALNRGLRYWSRSVSVALENQYTASNSVWRLLTPTEMLVLAVVGDGSDDGEAAGMLGLKPATILSVRKELHFKLGVRHRGELIRRAFQYGIVGVTPNGVVRPGFAMLRAASVAVKKPRNPRVMECVQA